MVMAGHDDNVARQVGVDIARKFGTPREIFGMAITELRVKAGKSQASVAAAVGCEEFYLRNIEQGKENFSFDVMFAIIDYFGMLPLSKFWHFAEHLASSKGTSTTK